MVSLFFMRYNYFVKCFISAHLNLNALIIEDSCSEIVNKLSREVGGAENVGDVHFKTVLGIPVAVSEKDGHRGTVPVHHLSDCSSPV